MCATRRGADKNSGSGVADRCNPVGSDADVVAPDNRARGGADLHRCAAITRNHVTSEGESPVANHGVARVHDEYTSSSVRQCCVATAVRAYQIASDGRRAFCAIGGDPVVVPGDQVSFPGEVAADLVVSAGRECYTAGVRKCCETSGVGADVVSDDAVRRRARDDGDTLRIAGDDVALGRCRAAHDVSG